MDKTVINYSIQSIPVDYVDRDMRITIKRKYNFKGREQTEAIVKLIQAHNRGVIDLIKLGAEL